MSAVIDSSPTSPDLAAGPGIPFSRVVKVELRKSADTLAGRWLLIAIVAITVLIIGIFFATADAGDRTFENFLGVTATPQGFLLPVLGILLVTSEWSQRTGLVTFTLTPKRARVVLAKIVASLLLGLAAIVVAIAIAALATVIGGAEGAWDGDTGTFIAKVGLAQLVGVLQGVAFGLLILNSAAAIVTFFVLPTAFSILTSLWSKMSDIQPWADLGFSSQKLYTQPGMSGEEWWQLASGVAIWVVLPLVLGSARLLRAEVK